jgi:rod shape-determining protein MreD
LIKTALGLFIIWLLAALVVRDVFSDLLTVAGVRPDLLMLVLVYWALATGPVGGTIGGFLIGLIADAELGRGLGVQAGLFSIAGFGVGQAGRHLIREHVVLQLALLFFGTLFLGMGRVIALVHDEGMRSILFSMPMLLGSALYTALLGPALYWLMRRIGFPDLLRNVHAEE